MEGEITMQVRQERERERDGGKDHCAGETGEREGEGWRARSPCR